MFLELLDKYEKERERVNLPNGQKRHEALFDFALWLENNAAQHGVEPTCPMCGGSGVVQTMHGVQKCLHPIHSGSR